MIAAAVDTSWPFAPFALVTIAAYGAVYGVRWRRVRKEDGARAAPLGAAVAFAAGLLAVAVALASPLDTISEQLASGHMLQHLLLADLAAIGLIAGLTKTLLRPITRRVQTIEEKLGPLAHPVFGAIFYVAAMWLWHVPALYDAALESTAVHVLQHLTYALAGFLYWWPLLSPIRSRHRLKGLAPIAYMAVTKILVGFLGIYLAFTPDLIYDGYGTSGELWGLSPLDDIHVAGLIMALEQSIVMGIALVLLFVRMLGESEREADREERYPTAKQGQSVR